MSINQINDEGAVIGYKPTLEYVKKGKSEVNAQVNSRQQFASPDTYIQYSETIDGFSNNLPSSTLKTLDFVVNNMRKLIDKLASSFKSGDWNQYNEISSFLTALESNNEEHINNFIEYHKNNIKGSIIPELISLIYNTEQRIKILGETIKELYYGDSNIDTENIEDIDNSYLKKIQSCEISNETSKINYLALSNDSILNKSINMYAFSANRQAIDIASIVQSKDNSFIDSSKEDFIKKMFNEINESINFRKDSYNEQQNVEIIKKTLYNYYNKRQEIIDLYDLYSSNRDSSFFESKIETYDKQVNEAITNVNKVLVGNQYFLSEMAKLEREKHLLMNIYATVNYKSEI